MKSLKDAMSDRSAALAHHTQARAAVDAAKTNLAKTRHTATTKPEAVMHVRSFMWGHVLSKYMSCA